VSMARRSASVAAASPEEISVFGKPEICSVTD